MNPRSLSNHTLTAVPGITVGHATDRDAATGCTVILGPFRAAVDIRGLASGTRQFDSLAPEHLVERVDAILLTGGSAFGFAAADGVARWLEEAGRGHETPAGRVAIVPTAVIFDLGVGQPDRRPDAALGRAACEAATAAPVTEGRVGVGAGASVGKLQGHSSAMPGGLGCNAMSLDDHVVAVLVVVNAFGDVLDGRGEIVAGARDEAGRFIDTAAHLREHGAPPRLSVEAGGNTTLAVVATDLSLSRVQLRVVARQAMNAVAKRIAPACTQYDGDLVFACSTGEGGGELTPAELLRVGLCAEWGLERAIERAVRSEPGSDRPGVAPDWGL